MPYFLVFLLGALCHRFEIFATSRRNMKLYIAVMGPIALALLETDIPALLKYPILAITTYAASNLIAFVFSKTLGRNLARKSL